MSDEVGKGLSKEELRRRINLKPSDKSKLFVTPLIDSENQLDHSTVTLRLGTEFILFRKTKYSYFDPLKLLRDQEINIPSSDYQERTYVELGQSIIIHPHQLILGCTLEYIGLPYDLIGQITARSSWGRLGLVIETANIIHPTFKGVITLELTNYGDTPITLYPGSRVAQILLTYSGMREDESSSSTKYLYETSPGFSRIFKDPEWAIIKKIRDNVG